MNILYLIIPLGLLLLGVAVWAFMWAVRSGQFDDLEGPAHRILMDDDEKPRDKSLLDSSPLDSTPQGNTPEDHSQRANTPLHDKDK